ncbi:sulfotransferase 1C3-like [Ptychodera flava]|uniref:sulfotransferase 1C3-like n=1 Tax=Ptychodera flava TaxID=63121 RepID=UPI003969D38B
MANLVGGFYRYKGIPFLDKVFPKYCLEAMETFEVREDDVFVVTYPRSGTVMMQQIVSLIVDHEDATAPTEVQLRDRIPFLERHHPGKEKPEFEILQTLPSPRLIKTHLSRQLAPPQMFEKKAKVLYLVRNPKDAHSCLIIIFSRLLILIHPSVNFWTIFWMVKLHSARGLNIPSIGCP